MILEEFLEKLHGVKSGGSNGTKQYLALCPAHPDKEHSLSIKNGEKSLLVYCHAGCDFDAICHALDVKPEDLFYEDKPLPEKPNHQRRLIATYNYYDEDAVLAYRVLRYEPKGFMHQSPDGSFKAPDKRYLYNFPAVLNADASTIIWITEGEKDADRLIALGFCATTNSGGAAGWREEFTDYLANLTVYICQDKDPAGLERTKKLYAQLKRVGCEVLVKEAKVGNDLSDHLEAGFALDELETFDPSALKVPATSLPESFWRSRPALMHIRQAAHSRQRSAEAVLHATLGRIAASCPYQLKLPPIVAATAALTYFTLCLDDTGVGKSSIGRIAKELLPAVDWLRDDITLGSGQGLAEVLMGRVQDPNDPNKTIRGQEFHNANLMLDEGLVLKGLTETQGTLLIPTLCTIWSGGPYGQNNASDDNTRNIEDQSYVFGLFIAIQTKNCGFIMDDVDTGFPQRFSWAMATDPLVPDIDDQPDWPGRLSWKIPASPLQQTFIKIDPAIVKEVKLADLSKVRGEDPKEAIESHYYLYRLKVAALLAILDGRPLNVTLEDWELSKIISRVSDACREKAIGIAREEKNRLVALGQHMAAQKKLAEYKAVEDEKETKFARDVARLAYWAALKAQTQPWTVGALRRKTTGNDRSAGMMEAALDYACEKKWVAIDESTSPATYNKGPVAPKDPQRGL